MPETKIFQNAADALKALSGHLGDTLTDEAEIKARNYVLSVAMAIAGCMQTSVAEPDDDDDEEDSEDDIFASGLTMVHPDEPDEPLGEA